VVKTL